MTLQENLSTATNKIEEHEQKEKDFEESVNELNTKVQTLEKSEEDLLVSCSSLYQYSNSGYKRGYMRCLFAGLFADHYC